LKPSEGQLQPSRKIFTRYTNKTQERPDNHADATRYQRYEDVSSA